MPDFDTNALLASIRERAQLPPSTAPGYSDSDLLTAATEELISKLAPELVAEHAEYFATTKDVPLVAGTPAYEIPSRAILNEIRELQLVDSAGVVTDLDEMTQEDLDGLNPTTTGVPKQYLFRADSVVLYPTPDSTAYSLRWSYLRSPSKLILPSAAMLIAGTGGSGAVLTGTVPTALQELVPHDVVKPRNPWWTKVDDVVPTDADANSVTFDSADDLNGAEAGDYLCLAGESPFPQLPKEWHAVLAQRVANSILRLRDPEAYAVGQAELRSLLEAIQGALADRNEGEPAQVTACPMYD